MAPQPNRLVMRTGPTPGKSFALSKNEIFIGRDITNDIVINDAEVSRKHAQLTLQTEGYQLEDLGSTNGTFVDGRRITGPHLLKPGELIMLADNVSLLYEAIQYDPTAAVAGPPVAVPSQPLPAASEPSFVGGPPGSPAEPAVEETRNPTQIWLLAGCGCLALILCVVFFAIAYYIDINNLWCSIPGLSDLLPCP